MMKTYLQMAGFLTVGTIGIQSIRKETWALPKEEIYGCLAVSVLWPISAPLGIGTAIYEFVYDEKIKYNLHVDFKVETTPKQKH